MPERLPIAVGDRKTTALVYPADTSRRLGATLVLAHGAGAGQSSRFTVDFANALSTRGVDVITFNFFYTEERRKVPDRAPLLEACYRAVVETARAYAPFAGNKVIVGGKSMGGRIASHLAAADDATAAALSGLVLLGYPLHPPGKPDQLRVEHLPRIRVPVLILQGERDPFGSPEELRPHLAAITAPVTLHGVERGDHSLAVRAARGSADDHYAGLQDTIATWIANVA
jgi:uncharacterized protein